MPVAIGEELKLENNRVNALYDRIFHKLNVAKAWTSKEESCVDGHVEIYDSEYSSVTVPCDYNKCYTQDGCRFCIINGKFYIVSGTTLTQIGSRNNWKYCTDASPSDVTSNIYAINELNELYYFQTIRTSGTYESMTQVGSGIEWYNIDGVSETYAIGDGKLYYLNGTSYTQIGTSNQWLKVYRSGQNKAAGICGGYIHYVNGSTDLQISQRNDFINIVSGYVVNSNSELVFGLTITGEVYLKSGNSMVLLEFNEGGTIKDIFPHQGNVIAVSTEGVGYSYYDYYNEWHNELFQTAPEMVINGGVIGYIGNGELHSLTEDPAGNMDWKISTKGYKKIMGNMEKNNHFVLAWYGDTTESKTTVYTTENPLRGDKVYSDTNLTEYSTVEIASGPTMIDNHRTYIEDTIKNSSFNGIPPASAHETIKAIDLLKATE